MSDSVLSLLEAFSEAAVLMDGDTVAAFSPLARHYLPQLQAGAPAPACLPRSASPGGGIFSCQLSSYSYTSTPLKEGQLLVFRPAPQTAVTDAQLDGSLRQLRQFLGELLLEAQPDVPGQDGAAFRKTFYRMFRLLDNLEYLRLPEETCAPRGTLDLAGLCRQTAAEAAPLLLQREVALDFACPDASILIPGDAGLLRRAVLELIANSARAVGRGSIHLRLRAGAGRALLSLSDSGDCPTQRQLAALLQQDADQNIPAPGAGAGLGLTVVRRIVAAHRGTMLVEWGGGAPTTLISLPTGPLETRAAVNTPALQRDGGLSPVLTALADVLPASVFALAELD